MAKQKGVALIIVVFAIMLSGILCWTLANLYSGSFSGSELRTLDADRALAAAEAGCQWMLNQLKYGSPTKGSTYTHTLDFGAYDVSYRDPVLPELGTHVVVAVGYAPAKTGYRAARTVKAESTVAAGAGGGGTIDYIESEAISSTTSTTLQTKATLNLAPTASTVYLIIASANITNNTTAKTHEAVLQVDGTTYHQPLHSLTGTANLYRTVGFSKRVTLAAGSHTAIIKYRSVGGGTTSIKNARIAALQIANSGDLDANQYDEDEAASSTSNTAYQTKSTITFTPSAASDYYALGTADFLVPSTSAYGYTQLYKSTSTTEGEMQMEDDVTTAYYTFAAGRKFSSLSGSQNFQIQYKKGTANAQLRYSHLSALNLTNYENYYCTESETAASTTSTSYQPKTTLTFTPSTAGNHLIIASAIVKNASASYIVKTRLNIDGTLTDDYITEQQMRPKDVLNWVSYFAIKQVNLTAASHTIITQWCTNNASGVAWIRTPRIIALKPKAGSSTVTVNKWSE